MEDGERWLRWMKIEEDGGRCRKEVIVEDGERWRKMAEMEEDGGRWRKMEEDK